MVPFATRETRNWNFVNVRGEETIFRKKNRKRTMHFLPWMDGENRGWKLTPRWNVTDSHRGKDFLMVSIGSWSFSNKRRLIGRRLPYPSKKGGPFREEPVPPRLGTGVERQPCTGWRGGERGRRTSDVSHPPSTLLYEAIQPGPRWKRSHFHPFRPWTSCRRFVTPLPAWTKANFVAAFILGLKIIAPGQRLFLRAWRGC